MLKILMRVPTVQFGYIEIEGTEKDLDSMVKIQNKYGEPLKEKEKQLVCSTCGAILLRSKAGALYCPNSFRNTPGNPHKSKTKPTEAEKKFNESLK